MHTALVLLAAIWLLVIHSVLLASAPPVVRHLQLHIGNWPASAPPMRIALLSDLHVATPGDSPGRLRHTVAQVNALHPDLVLIAGDFMSTKSLADAAKPAQIAAILGRLRAPFGSVAVLGNHDNLDQRALAAKLPVAGVTLLRNGAARRGPITILGIDDINAGPISPSLTLARGRALGGLPIVLVHQPDIVPRLDPSLNIVLAGHTHCGQVSPWPIGPIITSSRYGRRYACGLIREGPRVILVTAGLGSSNVPFRIGAEPDIWMIELGR